MDNSYRVYSTGELAGLKLAVFDHLCDVLVTYKGIPPYILVCFLPRFGLISGECFWKQSLTPDDLQKSQTV